MTEIQQKWNEYQTLINNEKNKLRKKELLKEYKVWKKDYKELTHKAKYKECSRSSKRKEYKTDTNYSTILMKYVEENKKRGTEAEKLFYSILKANNIYFKYQEPFKFTNQTWRYILDFYFPSKKLIIEIDGGYHNTEEQRKKDIERDRRFRKIGINVIRLSNDEVLNLTNRVINLIKML